MRKICEFEVSGRPVPWGVPRAKKLPGGEWKYPKDERLRAWQRIVADAAIQAMGDRSPFLGPVMIRFVFFGEPPAGHRDGEWWDAEVRAGGTGYRPVGRQIADLTNLQKGTEDALATIVFGNDVQVVRHESERRYGPEGVAVEVWSIDDRAGGVVAMVA
jgi:Holliday junction resolvase RusA-like endonuclease